jgi:hypothetical protein
MPLDYIYQEVIHMKVSHLTSLIHELMSSCVVRYGIVIIYGGTDWITSIRGFFGLEWGITATETGDFAR